jgi:hypothetical protein
LYSDIGEILPFESIVKAGNESSLAAGKLAFSSLFEDEKSVVEGLQSPRSRFAGSARSWRKLFHEGFFRFSAVIFARIALPKLVEQVLYFPLIYRAV